MTHHNVDLSTVKRLADRERTYRRDFEERKRIEFEAGRKTITDELAIAVAQAIEAGAPKRQVAQAMNISATNRIYELLERVKSDDIDLTGSISSEFRPDSNTVTVRLDRFEMPEEVPAANGEPVTLEATFDVSLLADGTPYYFPVDDDFTPLTVQFAKILPRYI